MNDIQLPNFEYIDTNIGLKYLNNNKELYLKILKNFLSRYRDLQLDFLDKKDLKDTIHSIKGLSSTLGMVNLSKVATIIHNTNNMSKLPEFNRLLSLTVEELKLHLDRQIKTILIVNDKIIDIDILIELLGEKYDIVVALDENSAFDIIENEDISVVLFDIDSNFDTKKLYNKIIEESIPIIFIIEDDSKQLDKFIPKDKFENYISKPFNLKKIEKYLKKI